jgi:hypothetical protein
LREYLNLKDREAFLDQLVSLSDALKKNQVYQKTFISMLNMIAELFPQLIISGEDLIKIFAFISNFEEFAIYDCTYTPEQ